jgi:molybdate transport system substrate-binding protein
VLEGMLVVAALAAIIAAAAITHPAAEQDKSIVVFAATSMKNALDDIDNAFTKKTGIKVVATYAASSALMQQIEQDAPADVFLSADVD